MAGGGVTMDNKISLAQFCGLILLRVSGNRLLPLVFSGNAAILTTVSAYEMPVFQCGSGRSRYGKRLPRLPKGEGISGRKGKRLC